MTNDDIDWREPELAALAERYDDATVMAALNIAQHIEKHGIEGIFFREKGEAHLEQLLPAVTERKVTKHCKHTMRAVNRTS